MKEALAAEIMDAFQGQGNAIQKTRRKCIKMARLLKILVIRGERGFTLMPNGAKENSPGFESTRLPWVHAPKKNSPSPPHPCGGEGRGERRSHPPTHPFTSQPRAIAPPSLA